MDKVTGNKDKLIAYLCTQDSGAIFDVAPHHEKRSLNQNSYYWKLCGMVAEKQSKDGVTSAMIHNRNLRDLGLLELFNGSKAIIYIPDTETAEKQALNSDTLHLKPTSQIKAGNDGVTYRAYVMLRGSHTFSVSEMAALLNLMVQDAEALGIEVKTPAELERMRQLEEEADNLTARRKVIENKAENLKKFLKNYLGGATFKDARTAISYRKSTAAVFDGDIDKLQDEYCKHPLQP